MVRCVFFCLSFSFSPPHSYWCSCALSIGRTCESPFARNMQRDTCDSVCCLFSKHLNCCGHRAASIHSLCFVWSPVFVVGVLLAWNRDDDRFSLLHICIHLFTIPKYLPSIRFNWLFTVLSSSPLIFIEQKAMDTSGTQNRRKTTEWRRRVWEREKERKKGTHEHRFTRSLCKWVLKSECCTFRTRVPISPPDRYNVIVHMAIYWVHLIDILRGFDACFLAVLHFEQLKPLAWSMKHDNHRLTW